MKTFFYSLTFYSFQYNFLFSRNGDPIPFSKLKLGLENRLIYFKKLENEVSKIKSLFKTFF